LPSQPVLNEGCEVGEEVWEIAGSIPSAELARVAEPRFSGAASCQVTAVADGEYRGITQQSAREIRVMAGERFLLSLYLNAPSPDHVYFVGMSWFDAQGVFIGDARIERIPEAPGEFELWELGGTVPAGAVSGRVTIYRVTDAEVTFYVDEVQYRRQ
jgi:hypothetical protein